MDKKQIILIPSKRMDNNEQNDGLIRLSAAARDYMDLSEVDDAVELWSDQGKKAVIALEVYKAFTADVRELKDKFTSDDLKRIGFVSTKIYNKLANKNADKEILNNIWVAKPNHELIYGADPEFLLFDNGKVIKASNILSHDGLLGSDGAMAEIRPNPNEDIAVLVENMRNIFNNAPSTIKKYDWMSCCYFKDQNRDYPVGGHIHIGNTEKVAKMTIDRRQIIFRNINKILDELLAIPMIKLDGVDQGSARRTKCTMGKYGFFGEYRLSGENSHFEYRTLSGMWLTHPTIAKAVIGTAKMIVDEIYNLISKNKYNNKYVDSDFIHSDNPWHTTRDVWKTIPLMEELGCIKSSTEMRTTLNESISENITNQILKQWYDKMVNMSTYKHNKSVDSLYEILKIPIKTFNEYNKELKTNWLDGNTFITD